VRSKGEATLESGHGDLGAAAVGNPPANSQLQSANWEKLGEEITVFGLAVSSYDLTVYLNFHPPLATAT
jgi:hypothetical protein